MIPWLGMGEREPRVAALEQENEALRQSLRAQAERLARISHDVRTPLNAILAASDLLSREESARLSAQGKEDVATLRQSAHAVVGLLDDLVGLAKLESGSFEIVVDELEPGPLIHEALLMARAALGARPVEVVVDGTLPRLRTDGLRLRHVALDMILAAARWHERPLALRARAEGGALVLAIDAPAGSLEGNEASSLSLELAVVVEVSKVLGGVASVVAAGDGAELVVRFPPLVERRPLGGEAVAAGPLPRVLYIDDAAPNRAMVRRWIEGEFELLEAADAESGIARAERDRPALVLMDLSLPNVDGWEAARRIKAIPALALTPIVAVSGYSGTSDRDRARAAGCVDYLTKPIDRDALLQTLRRHLASHAA